MGISCTVSEIKVISVENCNFFTPRCFAPPLEGFPLKFGTGAWDKKTRMMFLPGRERSLTISSPVLIQYTNVTDRRTDGQTDTEPQQRPRLHIASRGKIVQAHTWSATRKHQVTHFLSHLLHIFGLFFCHPLANVLNWCHRSLLAHRQHEQQAAGT